MFGYEWNINSLYHIAFPNFISMSSVDKLKNLFFYQIIEVCKVGIWYLVFWFYHRIDTCRDGNGSADMWRLPNITNVYTWGCKCEMLLLSNGEPCARYNCLKLSTFGEQSSQYVTVLACGLWSNFLMFASPYQTLCLHLSHGLHDFGFWHFLFSFFPGHSSWNNGKWSQCILAFSFSVFVFSLLSSFSFCFWLWAGGLITCLYLHWETLWGCSLGYSSDLFRYIM